jgi:hypothetical protein
MKTHIADNTIKIIHNFNSLLNGFARAIYVFTVSGILNLSLQSAEPTVYNGPISVIGWVQMTNHYVPSPQVTFEFELDADDDKWRLTVTPPLGKSLGYSQTSLQDNLLYSLKYWNRSDLQTARQTTNLSSFCSATIVTNLIPEFDGSYSRLLWLAACHHSQQSLRRVSPCLYYPMSEDVLINLKKCPYTLILDIDDKEHFIRSFTLLTRHNYTTEGRQIDFPNPFTNGVTLATFRQAVEQSDGRTTKRNFVYTLYLPSVDTNTITGQTRAAEFTGQITQSRVEKISDDVRPLISDRTLVHDYRPQRFAKSKISKVTYFTSTNWPGETEAIFKNALQEANAAADAAVRWWIKPTIFIVSVMAIVTLLIRMRSKAV